MSTVPNGKGGGFSPISSKSKMASGYLKLKIICIIKYIFNILKNMLKIYEKIKIREETMDLHGFPQEVHTAGFSSKQWVCKCVGVS